jgi:hypothetical protein
MGPIPLIMPDPRYFSMPSMVVGGAARRKLALNLGPGSQFAARAALASRRQGKYAPFHNALMQATEQVTEESVMEIAREVGLDVEQLRADMDLEPAAGDRRARLEDSPVCPAAWLHSRLKIA